jgi:hypothetical protein
MLQASHLNKFVSPLAWLLIFPIASVDLTDNLERIKELVNRL